MGSIILPWLVNAPDDNIAVESWEGFLTSLALVVLMTIVLFTMTMVLLYRRSAHARLVRSESELFSTYTPTYWVFLAAGPFALLTGGAWYWYDDVFPDSTVSFLGDAVIIGLYAGLVSALLALALFKLVTPAKFKYRVYHPTA